MITVKGRSQSKTVFGHDSCLHVSRRDGRVVEGTPLLRVQGRNPLEGSNPSLSATF
jgi:hypothetical protein